MAPLPADHALVALLLQEGMAVLSMPDGQKVEFPVLLDAAGAKFIDVSRSRRAGAAWVWQF